MQWLTLGVVILIVLGGPYWLFVAPMSRALLRAVRIARDPMHRVTPEGAWELFDRMVWNRLIPLWLLWTVLLFASCMAGPMMYIILGPLADQYPLLFFYALIYPAHLGGTWSMAFAGLMWWVPGGGSAGLRAKVTLTVVGIQATILGGTYLLLGRLAHVVTSGKEVWTSFAIITLLTGLAMAMGGWRRARLLGDAWFQFEEDRLERAGNRH